MKGSDFVLAVNYSTIRKELKAFCDKVTDDNETVVITRKDEKNLVLISLEEWNFLQKALKNSEYLSKLNRSVSDVRSHHVVSKSLEELEAMENE